MFVLVHVYMCLRVKQYVSVVVYHGLLQVPVSMPEFPQQNVATTSGPPQAKCKKPRNKKRMGEHAVYNNARMFVHVTSTYRVKICVM